ncbi:hypothetical protein [Tautonia plasticadhaerens]|uniref:Uncharacterized protein n=1 Tax=Tautonia plasticadhaerens TaxID=2527974 RepID=A0A518H5D1_9BACT|nr:hypothetical protein [Tautonia plasticadhaerens]QDV36018.1 hypothetical protein ElP_39280 [Tautonia plasticadhaerens]
MRRDASGRPIDPPSRPRRARRRQALILVAAIGAILSALVLAFALVFGATRPRTQAEGTFDGPRGHQITARIIRRSHSVKGDIQASGPGSPNAMMTIDLWNGV